MGTYLNPARIETHFTLEIKPLCAWSYLYGKYT